MRPLSGLLLASSLCGLLACGGGSDSSGPASGDGTDGGHDSAIDAFTVDSGKDGPIDSGVEVAPEDGLTPSDAAAETGDAGGDTGDASVCPPAELLFPPSKTIAYATKLLPFAGYLWISSSGGLTRAPLSPGAPTAVPKVFDPEIHAHGSNLVVVDGFQVELLDPSTLVSTHLFDLTGTFSNYFPRTELDGESLLVLRDDPAGSELGRVALADGTWSSLWKGPKVDGIHRAKDRTLLFGKSLVTLVDTGSSAPAIDATGFTLVKPLASDASGTYLSMFAKGLDIYRVPNGSATPVPLAFPGSHGGSWVGAGDGTRFVAATNVTGGPFGEYLEDIFVLSGTTWTKLPCVSGVFLPYAATIVGGYAYVANGPNGLSDAHFIVRTKLP